MSAVAQHAAGDVDLAKLELVVVNRKLKSLDTRIEQAITDGTLERTMEGASTLTITLNDPRRALLQSGVFSRQVDVRLDTFAFRLVKVVKSGDDLTLTFEDKQVALLRGPDRTKKANRKNVTRAQFALSLIREIRPHIAYKIPELKQRQPTALAAKQTGKGSRSAQRRAMPFQFRRGATDGSHEDSWTCLQRLASEVGWRCFCSAGVVWFVSENWLLAQKAIYAWDEQTVGISGIDFDVDNGKANSDMTVTARAGRWQAGPGAPVQIDGLGPANGIWLVSRVSRGLFDAEAQITLKRPTKKLQEPAPETAAIPSTKKGKLAVKGSRGASSAADKVYAAAVAMDAKKYPYVWGGGHGAAGRPSGGGYDCSGSTCAILAAGGLGFHPGGPVMTSGTIASRWGAAGEGHLFTVYANGEHVFVVFNTTSGKKHFGTGKWGKSWGGAGFNPNMHPTGGFVARHWPGL